MSAFVVTTVSLVIGLVPASAKGARALDSGVTLSGSVSTDNTPPTTAVLTPSTGSALSGRSAVLDATASAPYGVKIASVTFVLTGGSYDQTVIGTAVPSLYGYLFLWDTTRIESGTYTLQSFATDAAGNSAYSVGVGVTVDNTPPTTAVLTPSTGSALSGTSAVLDATASAPYGVKIASVTFVLTGGSYDQTVIGTAVPSLYGYLFLWDTTRIESGTYTLQSFATDAAGNSAYSVGVGVTVDNTPPTTAVLTPSTGSALSGTSAVLDATASAPYGVKIASVTFVLTGGSYDQTVIGTAVPSLYGYLFLWDTTRIESGTYTLQSFATDAAGNSAYSVGVGVTIAATPSVTALSPTSGPTGGISRESADFPQSSESPGNSSISINPVKVGDLVILSMQLHASGISISSVSGGNVSGWKRALSYENSGTDLLHYEVWWGVAAAIGPSSLAITYSAPTTSYPIELIADSFTSGSGPPWAVVATGGASGAVGTSANWPSLTSGPGANQLYWGASEEETAGTGGNSPGFVYNLTANVNCFLYNASLLPNTPYEPSCNEEPAAVSTEVGVIFAATGTTSVTISGTNFGAGDTVNFGAEPASGVTVESSSTITATAPRSTTPGTVDVTVTGPGGTSAKTIADHFTYVP